MMTKKKKSHRKNIGKKGMHVKAGNKREKNGLTTM